MNEVAGPEWLTMDMARHRHDERLAEVERDRLAARATEGRLPWWRRGWWGRPIATAPVATAPMAVATTGLLATGLAREVVLATEGDDHDVEEALALAGMSASEHA